MRVIGTLNENGTTAGIKPGAGKGDVRIRFAQAGGTIKLQHSLDDIDANYEDAKDPHTGNALSVTATTTVEGAGRRYYRMVGSGGVVEAYLEWHAHSDAG